VAKRFLWVRTKPIIKIMPPSSLNLSRFKKSIQGLIEFAMLIEQAEPVSREKIIRQTQAEDPDLLQDVLRKVVYFEEIVYLEGIVLVEILSKTPPKVLAFAIREMPEEFRKKILSQMGYRETKLTKEEDEKNKVVSLESILGARRQILKIARALEAKNKIVYELTDCPRLRPLKKTGRV
jgi:flagellar motor switch protein FliG